MKAGSRVFPGFVGARLQRPGERSDLGCLSRVAVARGLKDPRPPGGFDEAQTRGTEPECSVVARRTAESEQTCSGLRPGELREKAVQGEVVPVSVLLGPFL